MPAKNVLILGVCGIEKRQVADRLASWCDRWHHHKLRIVDFEHDFLAPPGEMAFHNFLGSDPRAQCAHWREAWTRLEGKLNDEPCENPTLLLLHGAIVRGDYGVRTAYDIDSIRSFGPDLIITLIDNVYDLWWRTEARAKGEAWRGRPTLEQLIVARRVEQLIGDQIANHIHEKRVRHVVLSVHHPCESAARLIFDNPRIVYLAFPISEPRRMLRETPPNERGAESINRFHSGAFGYQRDNPGVVFVSPIAIDERPLVLQR